MRRRLVDVGRSRRVGVPQRIATPVHKHVAGRLPLGIDAEPPCNPRRVVASTVVGKPALFVAFLAGEAITLARVAAEGGLPVGGVLLPAEKAASLIEGDR